MSTKEVTVWGIHGGRTGDAHALFTQHNRLGLGWNRVGDLSQIGADREAIKARLAEVYPDRKPGAIPVEAGQLFRFFGEMKTGDIVVYPGRNERQVHIGHVMGPYEYNTKLESGYPHLRAVKWERKLPRTQFSQGALYEIGSAMSFCQVSRYAEEFIAALEGKPVSPPAETDETVAIVAADIEQTTRDFILKRLAQELKGHPLAHFVAHLLNHMGYRTRVSPEGPDAGIDIVAHRDELGLEPPLIKVQVKSGEGSVGAPEVQALYGSVAHNEYGLFVSLGTFTAQAKAFARNKSNLRLLDADNLIDLTMQYYEQLDSRYKGLLPLKRVYVPVVLQAEG